MRRTHLKTFEASIPSKIELDLDDAIRDLKKYKNEFPYNLYSLSSRHVGYLKRMFAIIEGLRVPERIKTES
tara:strand:- start:86 stop:298 length:213 start_codon:yes stop_codon:yes gene_type:complete